MDGILEKFENTLSTEKGDESFKSLYKNWGKYGNQEQRRHDILQHQKSNRRTNLDNCRGIFHLIEAAEEIDIFNDGSQSKYIPNVFVPGFSRPNQQFENVLMHSEWMVEKPEDFSTNWYVTPCPVGVRVLVVASHGTTRCFTKYGQLRLKFSSLLPGGNPQDKRKNFSVLDCFYYKEANILYVLDVLSWNQHIMADGEMEFRQFWLRTKFSELPDLSKASKINKVIFKLLPMTPCDPESFQNFMMTYPPPIEAKLDGLLFYHKHASYIAGETPLVGWLFPYMVPEVIGSDISIHESYATGKPENYIDQATYIQTFEAKLKKKKFNGRRKNQNKSETSMDAEECPEDDSKASMDAQDLDDSTKSDGALMDAETPGTKLEKTNGENKSQINSESTMEPEECVKGLEAKTSVNSNTDTDKTEKISESMEADSSVTTQKE